MGNEESTMVDDSVAPSRLTSRSLKGLAEYMTSDRCKNIVVLTGAGISTSAGIPDFRSPETGLYANLARLNLPYAEAVFDISYFRNNPLPFYLLANELYPGKYKPTATHSFIRLLYDKSLLLKHFTQNIDCLDREAGVPGTHIIEAHGSFAEQSCIECKKAFPEKLMQQAVENKEPPHCLDCKGLVKPNIVFFGEALPAAFFEARDVPFKADLAIVMGTSLTVQPFASLPQAIPEGVPRVLINKEPAGGLGSRPDDVLLLGDCDEQVRKLAAACGWNEALDALWASTGGKPAAEKEVKPRTDETISDELDALSKEVDETLKLSDDHSKATRAGLDAKPVKAQVHDHLQGKTEDGGQGPAVDATGERTLKHVFPHI